MITSKFVHGKCVICGSDANGNHFGVVTCRACAAFFRRFHIAMKPLFKCKMNKNSCNAIENRWKCKRCRMKKCIESGMMEQKIQYNRDPLSSLASRIPMTIGRGSCDKSDQCDNLGYTSSIDFTPLLKQLPVIIRKRELINIDNKHFSTLEKLAIALRIIRRKQLDAQLLRLNSIPKTTMFNYWKEELSRAGEFFAYFDEFQELDYDDKVEMFINMWLTFTKFQNAALTAEMRVNQQCGRNEYIFTSGSYFDYNDIQLETDWLSIYSQKEVNQYMSPFDTWFDNPLIESIIDLQPNDIELSYIICCLSLQLMVRKLGGKYEEISDKLQSILSNDLHEYYSRTSITSSYSHRLIKLLDINKMYRNSDNKKRERIIVGKVLKIFNVRFSHPELVDYSN